MRKTLPALVEDARLDGPPRGGPYGSFRLRCPRTGALLVVLASDGRDWPEERLPGPPWEHVSVSTAHRCPMWEEMCWVKELFWPAEEWVIQYHPARADYVNLHPNVLHLWRPVGVELPTPPRACV